MNRLEPAPRFARMETGPTALIVPGLNNSGSDHWQTAWECERQDCRRVELGQWADPTPGLWVARLDQTIRDIPGSVVIVAHSLGCIATVLWSRQCHQDWKKKVSSALLVAPCDPEAESVPPPLRRFAPVPAIPLSFRSLLVASANDPYASVARAKAFADAWGSEFLNIGDAGHINSRSNLGCWRYGQDLLEGLLSGG